MTRLDLTRILAAAFTGVLLGATPSGANAQAARSYCLVHPGGEPGGCGFPSFQACLADSAGFGTCIATDQPAWGQAAAGPAPSTRKR